KLPRCGAGGGSCAVAAIWWSDTVTCTVPGGDPVTVNDWRITDRVCRIPQGGDNVLDRTRALHPDRVDRELDRVSDRGPGRRIRDAVHQVGLVQDPILRALEGVRWGRAGGVRIHRDDEIPCAHAEDRLVEAGTRRSRRDLVGRPISGWVPGLRDRDEDLPAREGSGAHEPAAREGVVKDTRIPDRVRPG